MKIVPVTCAALKIGQGATAEAVRRIAGSALGIIGKAIVV